MANVFISHRSVDNKPAEQLADELRTAGHNVWIDVWKLDLGDSIENKKALCSVQKGLKQAAKGKVKSLNLDEL